MKPDIHPEYRSVVFQDTSSDFRFLTKSTIETSETVEWDDGNTYPLAKVEISSASHPFYTGKQILVDTTGRVERFRKRYGQTSKTPAPAAADSTPEHTETDAEAVDAEA
ncbi:MAG: type B 50S ribosomal protein L31 [Acidimicrobiia bacterium]|nr:type B 50S ribosomal protein L31 [Acidimicrobiia bacterium]